MTNPLNINTGNCTFNSHHYLQYQSFRHINDSQQQIKPQKKKKSQKLPQTTLHHHSNTDAEAAEADTVDAEAEPEPAEEVADLKQDLVIENSPTATPAQKSHTNTGGNIFVSATSSSIITPKKTDARMVRFLSDPTVAKVLLFLTHLGVIEPREEALTINRKLEILKRSKQNTLQTHLGTEAPKRVESSIANMKKKWNTQKRVTSRHLYSEVEKFYTFFGGRLVMRHWRKEVWFGIPVKVWIFIYLLCGAGLIFAVHNYVNTPNDIYAKKYKAMMKYEHLRFGIQKLNENAKIVSKLGLITNPKVSKLTPSDRHSFRTKYVTEILADTAIYGTVRILFIYSTEKSIDALQRIEFQMDDEILRVNFAELDAVAVAVATDSMDMPIDMDTDTDMGTDAHTDHEYDSHGIDIGIGNNVNMNVNANAILDDDDHSEWGNKDWNNLEIIECPPDLFPLMHWFNESRREWFGSVMKYIWPIAPGIALLAIARWHFRSPPGLTNYILSESKEHVIIRRALGSPVHLQSDQWRGKLTSRSCNIRILLEGKKHKGKVHIVGYRDGSKRWLFPNCVLMIDGVKHDHYRELTLPPFEIPTADI